MAEEKPDGENPGSDPGKDAPSDTTPVADVAQDSIVEEAPISRAPNFAQLVLSWGVFSIVCLRFYTYKYSNSGE